MKILYDHQTFSNQKFGGVSRYFSSLIEHSLCDDEMEAVLPLVYTENVYLGKSPSWIPERFSNIDCRIKSRVVYALNKQLSRRVLKKGEYDIFHPSYYDPYFLEIVKKPFVITVYDMIHELFPQYFSEKDKSVEWKKKLIFEADKIIAISENTKKDIVKLYGIKQEKIEVIYLASHLRRGAVFTKKEMLQEYLLFVGNRGYYKNFPFFVKAIVPILMEFKDLHLVCAGSYPFQAHEMEMLSELGIQEKVLHVSFDDALLANLYFNAKAFVFPSLYEGFGIPVLEALNNDCIPILCNQSSLPEIGGSAALYFEAGDEESLRDAIYRVLANGCKEEMLPNIRDRAARFSWANTATKTKLLYQEVLLGSCLV